MLEPGERGAGAWARGLCFEGVHAVVAWVGIIAVAACTADAGSAPGQGRAARGEAAERGGELAWLDRLAAQSTRELRAAHIASVQRNAGEEYGFERWRASGPVRAHNASQGLTAELARGAVLIQPAAGAPDWSLELRWTGFGRGEDLRAVAEPAGLEVDGNRASYRGVDANDQWFLNGPLGIEQGFSLAERPLGHADSLIIELTVAGGVTPLSSADGTEVLLRDDGGGVVARYGELFAFDATHRVLDTWMRVDGAHIQLCIDDVGARYPLTIDPLIWVEQHELIASDSAAGDRLGAVSLSSDTALVGAGRHDDNGQDSGSAYVFVRSAGSWTEQAKLTASDGAPADHFGQAVSISNDTALVGALWDQDNGLDSGSAYVFVRSASSWTEQVKLTASDGTEGDSFGTVVSIAGDTALVGAPYDDDLGHHAGSAYVFIRSASSWTEQAKLTASDAAPGDSLGSGVSVDGEVTLVGALGDADNGSMSGSAYVFVRSASSWTEQAKLTASDGTAGDGFGLSASLSSDTALIGAEADDQGANAGAAYVFVRNATGWTEQQKITASDGLAGDVLGHSVSVDGDRALLGAYLDDDGGNGSGSAYVFVRSAGTWTEQQKLLALDGAEGDRLGGSVSLSSNTALVGAARSDDSGMDSGSAYVFALMMTGQACTVGTECTSTHCADGVCCNTVCGAGATDDCQACSIAAGAVQDGVCGPVADGTGCATGTCQGGICEAGSGGAGGGAGAGAEGGAGAAGAAGGSGAAGSGAMGGAGPPGSGADDDGGCGCRLRATRAAPDWVALGLLFMGLALAYRRAHRPCAQGD